MGLFAHVCSTKVFILDFWFGLAGVAYLFRGWFGLALAGLACV